MAEKLVRAEFKKTASLPVARVDSQRREQITALKSAAVPEKGVAK